MNMMVLFVLDDPQRLSEVLQAWESAGIRGATIIESTGFHRILQHIPMRYLFSAQEQIVERGHMTLLAIVEGEAQAQACLRATEALIGDLDGPNTGVFAAWPLALVKGLPLRGEE